MATSKPYVFQKRVVSNGNLPDFIYYVPADPEEEAYVTSTEDTLFGGGPALEDEEEFEDELDPNLFPYIKEESDENIEFFLNEVEGYQPKAPEPEPDGSVTNDGTGTAAAGTNLIYAPTDPRLVFNSYSDVDVLSFAAELVEPLVEGMVLPQDSAEQAGGKGPKIAAQNIPRNDINKWAGLKAFAGIPSIMNPNAYISFQAFRGEKDKDYYAKLMDQENTPRWYEVEKANSDRAHRFKAPTVSELVNWSYEDQNRFRQPYKFSDFAYCKYWQKIPNNYLITLRRFPFPTSDSLEAPGEGKAGGNLGENTPPKDNALAPVATAVTWLGESTGNKISTIVGPITTGLKWKDIEAKVNDVSPGSPGDAGAGPFPGIASMLGLISGDYGQTANATNGSAPPDPYTDGPWNNKIIGNVNVIQSVKARDQGLKFEHKLDVVFEYSARSIGSVNTKAAMLDIISNMMVMTSATAPFWGGMNRFKPGAPGNTDPFLGGPAGRAAWMRGDVGGFMTALGDQLSKAAEAISDFLFAATQDPIEALKGLAAGAASSFMKSNSTKGGYTTGIKAILTGEPVGEWHLVVGNPMNPILMIGNLICTGAKFEFSEELGPDDFPTELKVTVSLEHGMPRDRDAIESMFNAGGGRLYSLPPGYEESFSSSSQTAVDAYTQRSKGSGGQSNSNQPSSGGNQGTSVSNSDPIPKVTRGRGILNASGEPIDQGASNFASSVGRTFSKQAARWGFGYNRKTGDESFKT